MKSFLFGAAVVHALVAAWALAMTRTSFLAAPIVFGVWVELLMTCLALPLGASWLALEAAGSARRPRLFDARQRRPVVRWLAGLVSAVLSAAALAAVVASGLTSVSDRLIAGAASFVATTLVVIVMPRVRAGRCVGCGYDLGAITVRSGGVCPECGTSVMMAA